MISFMSAPESGAARLGRYVKQRRTTLRLSQAAAAKAAKISRPIWANVEQGTGGSYDTTYAGVDEALGWQPGSCERVLGGGEPTVRTNSALRTRAEAARDAAEFARTDPVFAGEPTLARIVIELAEKAIREEAQRPPGGSAAV